MSTTSSQFDSIIAKCREIFSKKMHDYGSAWRILRVSSLTDQIFIKANRIRTLQQTKENKVGEGVESEFIGIINYCAMALIQLELPEGTSLELSENEASTGYDKHISETKQLMADKNHDYGEAWRDMRVSSLTDLILMKLLRVKQIEDNEGETLISEGVDANYQDIVNYAVFAMILLSEER